MKNSIYLPCLAILIVACSGPSGQTASDKAPPSFQTLGSIERLDEGMNAIIPLDAKIEILANGFSWAEGPLWLPEQNALIFSDVVENTIYRWTETDSITIFLKPSGYLGDRTDKREPGSNGLALDLDGSLLLCQHGERQLARMASSLSQPLSNFETIVDAYNSRTLNSPNDLVINSLGEYFFTDPPYGLDPWQEKELDFQGVYKLDSTGQLSVQVDSLTRPNGVALSPDEKTLYVAVSDSLRAKLYAYNLDDDSNVINGKVFFDVTGIMKPERKGVPDGMKVDDKGNLFATGPGGVLIISPEGKHLGTILTGENTANCAFNEDKSVLYITANSYLLRLKLN